MAAPIVVNDSYATPLLTPLIVGQLHDFDEGGTAAQLGLTTFAGSFDGQADTAFIERGTAAGVGVAGGTSALWAGFSLRGTAGATAPVGYAGNLVSGWSPGNQTFTVGTAANVPLSPPSGFGAPYALQSGSLPAGVTINNAQNRLEYDGGGSPGSFGPYIIVPTASAEADWEARSTAAGVVYANRFDTLAFYALNANSGPGYYNNGNNQQRGFHDTTGPRCSGAGSLRLEHRGADTLLNPTGKFSQENGPLFGAGFGQNSTFYVQFRIRFDANYLAGERQYWNSSGSKIIIIHRNNATFAAVELTTQHIPRSTGVGYPSMYTSGGTPQLTTQTTGPSAAANPPFLIQSRWNIDTGQEEPGYRWAYNDPPTNAFRWLADTWYTLDYRVQITSWGANTSRVEAWVTPAGSSQRQKFVAWRGALNYNDSPSDTFNNLTLTGYCSNGSSSAPVDGSMWYDELIVSSQPIALPAALPVVP